MLPEELGDFVSRARARRARRRGRRALRVSPSAYAGLATPRRARRCGLRGQGTRSRTWSPEVPSQGQLSNLHRIRNTTVPRRSSSRATVRSTATGRGQPPLRFQSARRTGAARGPMPRMASRSELQHPRQLFVTGISRVSAPPTSEPRLRCPQNRHPRRSSATAASRSRPSTAAPWRSTDAPAVHR